MKKAHKVVILVIPVVSAISLGSPVSPEETLRDHLAMFRQVLHGNNRLVLSTNEAITEDSLMKENPSSEQGFKILPYMTPENNKDFTNIKEQINLTPLQISTKSQVTDNSSKTLPAKDISERLLIKNEANSQDTVSGDSVLLIKSNSSESLAISSKLLPGPEFAELGEDHFIKSKLDNDTMRDNLSGNEDYFEDPRLPLLLADGLTELLKNQLNYAAVFEFPGGGEKETHSENNDIDGLFTTTPTTSIPAISEVSTTLTSNIISVPKMPTIEAEDPRPFNSAVEGKANLKAVLDMANQFRVPLNEVSKVRKKPKPKTYIEKKNSTSVIDQPRKVFWRDLLNVVAPELADEVEPEDPVLKPINFKEIQRKSHTTNETPQQSLSEIRKIYFQSLERVAGEDLITYFHRIYPELQHLLGTTNNDENYQGDATSLLKKLVEETSKENESASNINNTLTESFEIDNELIETPTANPLRHIDEVDVNIIVERTSVGRPRSEDSFKANSTSISSAISSDPMNQKASVGSEHKTLLEWISERLHKFKKEDILHNPFKHEIANEAASLVEVYPSVIGAVIFALFLFLL